MRAGCRGLRGAPPGESLSEERVERRLAAIGRAIKLMAKGLPGGMHCGGSPAPRCMRDECQLRHECARLRHRSVALGEDCIVLHRSTRIARNVHLPAIVAVNGAESLVAAARVGLGLIRCRAIASKAIWSKECSFRSRPTSRPRRHQSRCSVLRTDSYCRHRSSEM
jgi:hypothetical protein